VTSANRQETKDVARNLPDGWRWVPLGEVCSVHPGQHILESDYNRGSRGIGYLTGPADFGLIYPSVTKWTNRPKAWCEPGDILVTVKGAGVGKANLAPEERVAIGRQLMAVRPKRGVADQRFIYCFVLIPLFNLQNRAVGSTVPGLGREDLQSLAVPLPPISEQRRIAAILNEQMAAVERARAATEARSKAANLLSGAYFQAVFNGPEAQGWPRRYLGEAGDIVSGVTLGRKLRNGDTRIVPYLRVANVKDGHLNLSDVYRIEATQAEIQKLKLRFGDLLLTEGGDPDKLGRGTFWKAEIGECIHQNHLFRVRFDLKEYSPEFVSAQIGSAYGKAYFLAHAKQTTGIATINQKVLPGFSLLSPPRLEQERIGRILGEQVDAVNRAREALCRELSAIKALPAALLRRAFSGEL
jgi:type I restriction enzyme S subunit